MEGLQFYFNLIKSLTVNQDVAGYRFIKWHEGQPQFEITGTNSKSIPAEILIIAKYSRDQGIDITQEWLVQNGCNRGWCLATIINELLDNYSI